MITVLALTDGRADCLARTLRSAEVALDGAPIVHRVLVNDSPDPDYHAWLTDRFADRWAVVPPLEQRRGFGGAIRAGWDHVAEGPGDYVFHLEDDFVFNRPVPLAAMVRLLDLHPHVAQVALLRQPWNDQERAAGGIVECHPGDYEDRHDDGVGPWLLHRRCFTTNPCLYRRQLLARGWPQVEHSEGIFTHQLVDAGLSFAYLGARGEAPRVHHIGDVRVGTGY